MKAIITNYNSPYYPIRIDWNQGKKSIVVGSVDKEGRFTDTTAVSRFDPNIEIL